MDNFLQNVKKWHWTEINCIILAMVLEQISNDHSASIEFIKLTLIEQEEYDLNLEQKIRNVDSNLLRLVAISKRLLNLIIRTD